ncbi:MAG TPA: MFS transporter [Candidatus Baltobacteraceae bacterium]|nr:MFS transporter [Candidatus Baltobacteraceae bacterium]
MAYPRTVEANDTTTFAGHTLDRSVLPLLLTLGLGVFLGALDLSVLAPALPALGKEFTVATGDLSWVFTIYLLVNIVGIAVMSTLADRYGRRPIYIACVSIFVAGSALAVVSHDYGLFLVARAIQAFGAGGIFPVATAAIGDAVPPQRRGAALGLVAATWGLAAVLGPVYGGLVTHLASWRFIFAPNFPIAALVLVLAVRHVPTNAPRARAPLDVPGLFLLCIGLLFLMYGITGAHVVTIAFGLLLLAGFVMWQRTCRYPIVPPALFENTQLAKTFGLEVLIGVLEGSLFFIPAVLVGAQHISYAAAGVIAAVGAFMFVAVIPGSGRALDRIGSRDVLLAGTIFTEAGLVIFALCFNSLGLSVVAMIVAGIGFGALLGAPSRYIVTNETTERTRATAIGLLSQFLIVGQIIGGSLAGGIMGHALSDAAAYRDTYLAFAGVALLALALASTLADRREEIRAAVTE